ncbi:hypothetical protein MLD38_018271 [Melastoma candidum]|uniref:Uncharacterized protein n=1 Tax=Melastoma candidum TaxID=119954 RepID=A0ACB9QXC4_9MYRT|nr:hypothetical protein MLD38_018271 [Melastoma candidum]
MFEMASHGSRDPGQPRPASPALVLLRTAIWGLSVTICLGIAMLWILMPTNTYRKRWLPSIRRKAGTSTFFGIQGSNLLMFMFPLLFVTCLSCIYLHLSSGRAEKTRKESSEKKGARKYPKPLKRPVLVNGPLGIVTATELAFLVMFVVLLIWSLSMYLRNSFAAITPQQAAELGGTKNETKLWLAGLYLGLVGNIGLAFLFFPVTRGSSLLAFFGLTSESSIKYHIWLGHMVMAIFTVHGLCYIVFWIITHQISKTMEWANTGISNVAGEIALVAGLGLWSTTFPRVRRKMFELFFYAHHLYILFMLFFVLHVGISYACIMLPGFYLFLVDRYLRFLQSRSSARLVSARVLPCDAVELNFAKAPGLKYGPMSMMLVKLPAISKLEWHPFTISSDSSLEQDQLSIVVKKEGSWSGKLCEMFSPSSIGRLEVAVEGPYGPASTDFLQHEKLVMVSGGSGITPFISIIRGFIHMSAVHNTSTPQLILVCSFKNSRDLSMLDLLLPMANSQIDLSNLRLKIEAYVTREIVSSAEHLGKYRTVCFSPNQSDEPLSPVLGPNSWLWLGAIISASFAMFLVIIGILTRYYIYPVDHNKNKFSTSSAKEASQIKHLEGSTPSYSPGSRVSSMERELESRPHQLLADVTNLNFGERPDLMRILLGCKESSVGVLVCGPKKMRHEVAALCSLGQASNLHFETISFSW